MIKDEFEAQSLFNQLQKRQTLLAEFEKLRPNWKSTAYRFTGMFSAIAYLMWMFPEIMQQPASYVFLILILGLNAELHAQSTRINHRIDALHRLFKDDA